MMGYVQIDISDADCFIYDSTKKSICSQATLAPNGGNALFFPSFEIINLGHLGSFRIISIIDEMVGLYEQFIIFMERPSYRLLGSNMWKPASRMTGHVLACIHYKQ